MTLDDIRKILKDSVGNTPTSNKFGGKTGQSLFDQHKSIISAESLRKIAKIKLSEDQTSGVSYSSPQMVTRTQITVYNHPQMGLGYVIENGANEYVARFNRGTGIIGENYNYTHETKIGAHTHLVGMGYSLFETTTHHIGKRVKICQKQGGMKEFEGKTGSIISHEKDGHEILYRVKLDEPVHIEGVGKVRDDLWSGEHLQKIKESLEEATTHHTGNENVRKDKLSPKQQEVFTHGYNAGKSGKVLKSHPPHYGDHKKHWYDGFEMGVEEKRKTIADKWKNESLEEATQTHCHSIFIKGPHKWSHHFDADSKEDANDEARSLKNQGETVKILRIKKEDLPRWGHGDGETNPHEYLQNRLKESQDPDETKLSEAEKLAHKEEHKITYYPHAYGEDQPGYLIWNRSLNHPSHGTSVWEGVSTHKTKAEAEDRLKENMKHLQKRYPNVKQTIVQESINTKQDEPSTLDEDFAKHWESKEYQAGPKLKEKYGNLANDMSAYINCPKTKRTTKHYSGMMAGKSAGPIRHTHQSFEEAHNHLLAVGFIPKSNNESLEEVAPPGREYIVKKLLQKQKKGEVSADLNPWAIAWSQAKKGDKVTPSKQISKTAYQKWYDKTGKKIVKKLKDAKSEE